MSYQNVLKEIESTRKELKISQRKLAMIIGVTPQYYSAVAKGRHALSGAKLVQIIEALGFNVTFSKIIK